MKKCKKYSSKWIVLDFSPSLQTDQVLFLSTFKCTHQRTYLTNTLILSSKIRDYIKWMNGLMKF